MINKKLPPPFLTCATASHHTTHCEVERFARAHQAYVFYNTDPTATTPPIPTASSTNATAATAEPEDNTNDYSLRTRKLGSSPVPNNFVGLRGSG